MQAFVCSFTTYCAFASLPTSSIVGFPTISRISFVLTMGWQKSKTFTTTSIRFRAGFTETPAYLRFRFAPRSLFRTLYGFAGEHTSTQRRTIVEVHRLDND